MTKVRVLLALIGLCTMDAGGQTFRGSGIVFVALGDVNLGRLVGQKIVGGDTLYPFRNMENAIARGDIGFANLESQLTDQGGETQHPGDNYIFCGPLGGSASLRLAGIDVVSTANNHAYDYGRRALLETVAALASEGIAQTGLSDGWDSAFEPVVLERDGFRVGVLAYTEFVNRRGEWDGAISVFDARRAHREIRSLKTRVDFVVASYHGGTEYTPLPPSGTLRNLRSLAASGADVVVGHHPHVPQGVEVAGSSVIFYSLGNFVFYQPQMYWTQVGLLACIHLEREGEGVRTRMVHLEPFRAGAQPVRLLPRHDVDSIAARFTQFSPSPVFREGSSFILSQYAHTRF